MDGVKSYRVHHYISILSYVDPDPASPAYKPDVYRLLYNLMAKTTAVNQESGSQGTACDPVVNKCPGGLVSGWQQPRAEIAMEHGNNIPSCNRLDRINQFINQWTRNDTC